MNSQNHKRKRFKTHLVTDITVGNITTLEQDRRYLEGDGFGSRVCLLLACGPLMSHHISILLPKSTLFKIHEYLFWQIRGIGCFWVSKGHKVEKRRA